MDYKTKISEIFGEDVPLEHWTADAGHDDYWCPDTDQIDKVIKVHELIKNNLEDALDSEYPYVSMFAYMIKDSNQKFMSGHEKFNQYFPYMKIGKD